MKRILISLMTIAIVAVVGFAVTRALFTDTETSTGNTFSTGTIDIAVDGSNPWSRTSPYALVDMKPSQTDYINFTVNNVGTNPVNVWKKITVTGETTGVETEPECTNQGGAWDNSAKACDWDGYTPGVPKTDKNDISSVIDYDLSVKLYKPSGELIWWQMIYNKDVTVAAINGENIFLGMIPEGWHMDVVQSYHMDKDTGNWAQGDTMTFDITLTGEQLKGVAVLGDKTGEPDWRIKTETTVGGTLTYGVKDSEFKYSFTGEVTQPSTSYSLIVYHEPWSTPTSVVTWPRPITVIGSATSDVPGNIIIPETSVDLNTDLINAKIWLVKTSDLSGNTISGWNWADYLFDTGLVRELHCKN